MRIIIILLLILSAIFLLGIDGCNELDQSGVKVTLKQIIPLSATTRIEITKTINMSELMQYTSSQDYLIEDSNFYVPIEI